MDNRRVNPLSPVLSKIFENCLLLRFNDYFSRLTYNVALNDVGCRDALLMFSSTVQYSILQIMGPLCRLPH